MDDPDRVVCTKVETLRRWGDAGWLHVLRDDGAHVRVVPRVRHIAVPHTPAKGGLGEDARQFHAALDPRALARFAASLGLEPASLTRLGVGWAGREVLEDRGTTCRGRGCWSFPMRNAEGVVVGIRLRTEDGFKYAVAGGKQGLFIPADLDVGTALLIGEGPTDTAALLDLGYGAVGRPSCDGGVRLLSALIKRLLPPAVVIVGDGDEPGQRGAAALAAVLRLYTRTVRVIRPPEGIKDARAWKASSLPESVIAQIDAAIATTTVQRISIASRREGR